jgi:hypothetical protein
MIRRSSNFASTDVPSAPKITMYRLGRVERSAVDHAHLEASGSVLSADGDGTGIAEQESDAIILGFVAEGIAGVPLA